MDKPGYQTTEFWIAILSAIAGLLLIYRGEVEAGTALIGVTSGGYAVSRGLAKKA